MLRALRVLGLTILALGLVCATVGLILFWPVIGENIHAFRQSFKPPVKMVPPPPAPLVNIPLPPEPPRKGNRPWTGIEAVFDDARSRRGEHISWKDNPSSIYRDVASPAFTDSADYEQHALELAKWHRELPDSPTALTALARAHLDSAWQARGFGAAEFVSQESWDLFYTRVSEARRLLEQAIQLGPQDGEAHRALLLVATAQGWSHEQTRSVLDEGRKLDPAYFPLYTQFARYLLPRWHGQRGDVERFAKEVTELLPGDDGLEACARIAADIHKVDTERELLFFGEYDRPLLIQAANVWRQRKEDAPEQVHFAALCAWLAQDRQAINQFESKLPEIDERNWIWPWQQHQRDFEFWRRNESNIAPASDYRWFWGSLFHSDQLVFGSDSQSIWCGQGAGTWAIYRLRIDNNRILHALPSRAGMISDFAIDERQGYAVASMKSSFFEGLYVWRLAEAKDPNRDVWRWEEARKSEFQEIKGRCQAVAISPTEPQMVYATNGTVTLLHLETKERGPSVELRADVRGLRFSADGKQLILQTQPSKIWNIETGELRSLPDFANRPRPDVACTHVIEIDEEGRIWAFAKQLKPKVIQTLLVRYAPDAQSFERLIPDLETDLGLKHTAILSSDRRLLAINPIVPNKGVPNEQIEVWDIAAAKKIVRFSGHHSRLSAMAFSPDSRKLATMGFPTGVVRIWDVEQ